ncbi:MAG TPA: DNA-binding response regulator [Bacteroidetes bacterium]|nr:DNA-binding response regulator [Bacteroidota bacterium]
MSTELRALIVDDEERARDLLQRLLEKYGSNIRVVDTAGSVKEAREILENTTIDVLFLDISMPNENGFDLLESLDASRYLFVFVTAYDQYALRALKASAVDYIQKPVDPEELSLAVEKLHHLKKLRTSATLTQTDYVQTLQSLMMNVAGKGSVRRLCLPGMQGFSIVDTKDILYLEADTNYTVFHLTNLKKIVVSRSIKEYEEVLDPVVFFRVHKSSIINLKYLHEFSRVDGYYAVMQDGSSIAVSRRKLHEFILAVEAFNHLPRTE